MDPTLDQDEPAVERGEDVRPIPDLIADNGLVLDLDALVCTGALPPGTCLATEHIELSVCRPDDMCWVLEPELHHVNHQCPCWHEVDASGAIQNLLFDDLPDEVPDILDGSPEPVTVESEPGEAPDPSPVLVEVTPDGFESVDPFITLRNAIYDELIAEGNPRQLSLVLASIYAMIIPSEIPETMRMLRSVGDSISGVLGDGGGGGIMGKLLSRAMKGNG